MSSQYIQMKELFNKFDLEYIEAEDCLLLYQGMHNVQGDYGLYCQFNFCPDGDFIDLSLKEE